MKNYLKKVLLLNLCLIFSLGSLFGCKTDEYQLEKTKLPCYVYSNDSTTENYNADIFYRNEGPAIGGDPTAIFIEEGEDAGYIYVTATTGGGNFSAYRTNNFTDWEAVGPLVEFDDKFFGSEYFVAPQYLYDPTAKYEDYGIEKEEGESGVGLYVLTFTARPGVNYEGNLNRDVYIAAAFSKKPSGPFVFFEGTNKNGIKVDSSHPIFDIEYINPETGINLDEGKPAVERLYQKGKPFNDSMPFIDPVTNEKYLYLKSSRGKHEVYAVKMKDWVSPDYTTFTRITSYGLVKPVGSPNNEEFNYDTYPKIDEGPFVNYHNGKYYLTLSVGGTSQKQYPVCQAVGDSPLGVFTKIQPEDGGLLCAIGADWDMSNSGHHSLFEIKGELWIVYHSYEMLENGGWGTRRPCYDRVLFKKNSKGEEIMVVNGPTKTLASKPEFYSGYKNLAEMATVNATGGVSGSNPEWLNDGYVKMHATNSIVEQFEAKKNTKITLKWDTPVLARAIMVYNSCEYSKIFEKIDEVTISYYDAQGRRGQANYKNWAFDLDGAIVPFESFLSEAEIADMENLEEYMMVRGSTAAIMEFGELKIDKIELTIKKPKSKEAIGLSEIMVIGKEVA